MEDEQDGIIQDSTDGQVGAGVRPLSSVRDSLQEGRNPEAHQPYGKTGEQTEESISKIVGFQYGYPKRITIDPKEPRATEWQKWFDHWYERICEVHHLTPEPRQNTML